MKKYLPVLAAGLMVFNACQPRAAAVPDKAPAEVAAAMHAYAAALLQGPAAVAACYWPEGELIEGTTGHRGPQGVKAFLQPIWDRTVLADARMESESVEVSGDIAYQWGTYAQRAAPKGQPLQEYRGRFVAKWRRGPDGRWLILRLMTNP